jgi:spermidine/putrescine transport system ATP-binding protein
MRLEIKEIQRSLGITTFYVTHDRAEALSMSTLVAVMNAGRIEMIGTPREIYERPATFFSAEFLGQCNRIPGRVVSRDGALARVETRIGILVCRSGEGLGNGDSVEVVLRPEDVSVRLAEAGPPPPDGMTGEVIHVGYYGDRAECVIKLGADLIRALGHPALADWRSRPVHLEIQDGRCWAIPTPRAGGA